MSCIAVIPARRAENTISATLESLRIGNDGFVDYVVVVTSADDPTADVVRAWSRRDVRVCLVAADLPMSAGAARNAGRDCLRDVALLPVDDRHDGRYRPSHEQRILFIDADCRLEAGGAERLAIELSRSGAAAVSARVIGHAGLVARVRHILEFKEAASMRIPPTAWLPPSTTMLCRADAFDDIGGFPDLWPGEDLVFAQALRDRGERVSLSTNVTTEHRHPEGVAEMLRHQYRLGRTAAIARGNGSIRGAFFTRHRWAAALLLPGRIVRIVAWQAKEGAPALLWTTLLSPLLLAGLAVWTVGFVVGAKAPGSKPHDRPLRERVASADGPASRPPLVARAKSDRGRRTRAVAVIPVFNGSEVLGECLDALLASEGGRLDIVVVDDASSDASLALARSRAADSGGRIRVLALRRNHGFAGTVNRAVAWVLAQGDAPGVLALVNQDCFVSPGWLRPLETALEDPTVAVAGARLLDADGVTLQHAGGRIEANGLTSHFGRGCRDPLAWRTQRDVDYVCGALIAMRCATWQAIGPLDEGYAPAYFEEVDLCVKARRAGMRVVYVPDCEARHVEASTSGTLSRIFLLRYHRSRLRFVMRRLRGEAGTAAWLRSEATWLVGLRRWSEIAPVLAAYAKVPLFLAELVAERMAKRDAPRVLDSRGVGGRDGRESCAVAAVAVDASR